MFRPKKQVESIPMGEISSSQKADTEDIQSNKAKKNRCIIIVCISAVLVMILAGATFTALWATGTIKSNAGKIMSYVEFLNVLSSEH